MIVYSLLQNITVKAILLFFLTQLTAIPSNTSTSPSHNNEITVQPYLYSLHGIDTMISGRIHSNITASQNSYESGKSMEKLSISRTKEQSTVGNMYPQGDSHTEEDVTLRSRQLESVGSIRASYSRTGPACLKIYSNHFTVPAECMNKTGTPLDTTTAQLKVEKRIKLKDESRIKTWTIFKFSTYIFDVLFKILENSVNIIHLDDEISEIYTHIKHGKPHSKRQDMFINQHSVELWIPYLLESHPIISKYRHTGTNTSTDEIPALFNYVPAHIFAFCTYALDENYFLSNPIYYWEKFVLTIINDPLWRISYGLDYIIPATHPLTPLNINDKSYELNILAHASFLVVDNDMKGRYPKDSIVPYYTETIDDVSTVHGDAIPSIESVSGNEHRSILLTFAGRPVQSVRGKIIDIYEPYSKSSELIPNNKLYGLRKFYNNKERVDYREIMITQDKIRNITDYYNMLYHSKFCLMIRGDTTSSSRLFTAIGFGCIPVIVSDWIVLPFEKIINYNRFSIILEESYLLNQSPQVFIEYLRNIPSEKIKYYQDNLRQAKEVLTYSTVYKYNPVTLMLMDNIVNRINMCMTILGNPNIVESYYKTPKSSMCHKIQHRLKHMADSNISDIYTKITQSGCLFSSKGMDKRSWC